MEGLWFADDVANFANNNKDEWQWTVMIMQPETITMDMVSEGIEEVRKRKNPVALDKVRFENFQEGLSVQVMYIGPYVALKQSCTVLKKVPPFKTKFNHCL